MAGAILLQDWNTVRGNAAGTKVTQQEVNYADMLHYQDVVIFMETSDVSGSPTISFETSPTRDDVLFQPIHSTATFVPSVGVTTKVLLYASVTVPLARFIRWKFTTASGAWTCTFRIWLSPNLS